MEIMERTFLRKLTLRGSLLILLGTGILLCELRGQSTIGPSGGSSAQVLLEVMNTFFTVGRKIPSVYLRIFSDHTVECESLAHAEGKSGVVTKRVLTPEEFEPVRVVIDEPELLKVQRRYELMHPVFDSWTEWEIKVQHADGVQHISVANFSPESTRGPSQPYPDALVMLGCSISRLRNDVCGDELEWRSRNCGKVLQGK
jgi:hypothetical protein